MMTFNAAQKRYNRAVLLLGAAYVLILFGVGSYFHNDAPRGALAYLAAMLPALPLIGIFFAMGRYIVDEQDEYLRMLFVRQSLIATGVALSLATAWGFLESFGLVRHLDSYWVAVVWFAGLGLGACINKLTLGRGA